MFVLFLLPHQLLSWFSKHARELRWPTNGSECKGETIDHRDSQRPPRVRGPKLENNGITYWVATDSDVDPSITGEMRVSDDRETVFDVETGTTTVRTSVIVPSNGLPSR